MVKVYSFEFLDEGHGRPEMLAPRLKSTIEQIEKYTCGRIFPGTEEEVDASELDEHGRYDPDKKAPASGRT
jgi:hypothetical protein